MNLQEAKLMAAEMMELIAPFCDKSMVCGSIRRGRPEVKDIDIVLVPNDMDSLKALCLSFHPLEFSTDDTKPKWGEKIGRFNYQGHAPIDLYFATAKNFPLLTLIRTGSAEHNVYLCTRAKDRGMYLAADGSGLFYDRAKTRAVPVVFEGDVFKNLDIPTVRPEDREIDKATGRPVWYVGGKAPRAPGNMG